MNLSMIRIYTDRQKVYKCSLDTFEQPGVTIINEESFGAKATLPWQIQSNTVS